MDDKKFEIRTDLALEERERIVPEKSRDDGIRAKVVSEENDIMVTMVEIVNERGSDLMKKPIGRYYTIEAKDFCDYDEMYHNKLSEVVAKYLKHLLDVQTQGKIRKRVLVVGLGNRDVTPDAIGPKVIENLLIGENVMAVAPGVLAQTGMETARIVKGIVEEMSPDIVIAVDALAARSVTRLNTTIQISSAGIYPGQGVGNHRIGITQESIGCPVVAIGVPTVVDAPTIISDVFDNVVNVLGYDSNLLNMGEERRYALIKKTVPQEIAQMFVTPKDIDATANRIGYIISEAINLTFE